MKVDECVYYDYQFPKKQLMYADMSNNFQNCV